MSLFYLGAISMGRFVNPDNRAFQAALNSKIYVDKNGLLEYTNSVLNSTNQQKTRFHGAFEQVRRDSF